MEQAIQFWFKRQDASSDPENYQEGSCDHRQPQMKL